MNFIINFKSLHLKVNIRIYKVALRYTISVLSLFYFSNSFGQKEIITADVEKDKPQKFQSKILKSEKTGEKKFTLPRKIMQNTVTHYNYYFNASNKLDKVIDRAKVSQKENFLKLLPFYPYSLNTTAAQKSELDSVIYKATAGILLHDLRNNWVDDLYFLIGKAYFFRKDFDSAGMTFQFINYNLAPRKKFEDDITLVGSNDNNNNGFLSIANKEKKGFSFVKKPARNDAILWQARTLITSGEYPEAAGLMNTLQNDPNFPQRLHNELEELFGYLYYQQELFDSSANHLEKSISSGESKQDKARKEFLIGQLYLLSKDPVKASQYFSRSAKNTTDPLMDIYANLNNAKIIKNKNSNELDNNIANLIGLAKKGKFENYRDIVYYSAGELALQKPDTPLAVKYFKKSISLNFDNATFKNKAFFQLANLEFESKHYKYASMYYDSIDVNDASLINDVKFIQDRKSSLTGLVKYINIIENEDSLQLLSKMPVPARDELIKKLLKKLRKENGLKEDQNYKPSSSVFNKSSNSLDIFSSSNTPGGWYFYNPAVKSKGYSEFKSKWGKRENVDNWRRQKSNGGLVRSRIISNPDNVSDVSITNNGLNPINMDLLKGANPLIPQDLTFENLLANVPTTEDKIKLSNTNLSNALFLLGHLYESSLEDHYLTIQTLERSLKQFPDSLYGGQLYSDLFYAYEKTGNKSKADYYKNLLLNKFQVSKYSQSILNPVILKPALQNPAATSSYDNIYNSFIEGDFEKALKDKKIADSLFGKTYWNPQLLYIEAVYHIRQREDSQALNILKQISSLYPNSPLKVKADNLTRILKRRKEIENYLTNLKVERKSDSDVSNIEIPSAPITVLNNSKGLASPKKEAVQNKNNPVIKKDSLISTSNVYSFNASEPQNVVMILDKVDAVYSSEARNAFNRYNKEKFSNFNISIVKNEINKEKSILIFSPFANADAALSYWVKIKSAAANEVSWLPANKYSFIIISDANIQVLKNTQNLKAYIDLLKTTYPGKF